MALCSSSRVRALELVPTEAWVEGGATISTRRQVEAPGVVPSDPVGVVGQPQAVVAVQVLGAAAGQ